MDKVAEELNRRAEWTDAEATAELKKAGARFTPDQKAELLRALPLAELAPFAGELRIVSAEFRVRNAAPQADASLRWIVKAVVRSSGREVGCTLDFEPFEGRLLLFYRIQ